MERGRLWTLSAGKTLARNHNAFTLLELIVTLFIMGLITALVGPRLMGHRPGLDLRTASRHVASIFRFASSTAVSESTTYCVAVGIETGQTVFYRADILDENESIEHYLEKQENEAQLKEDSGLIRIYSLPEGIRVEKIQSADGTDQIVETGWYLFVFYPNGSSTGGSLYLINSRDAGSVVRVAFVTGVVRIED